MNKSKLKSLTPRQRRELVDKYYVILIEKFYIFESIIKSKKVASKYHELFYKNLNSINKVNTRLKRLLDVEYELTGLHGDQLKWCVNRLEYHGQSRDSLLSNYVYRIINGNPWNCGV